VPGPASLLWLAPLLKGLTGRPGGKALYELPARCISAGMMITRRKLRTKVARPESFCKEPDHPPIHEIQTPTTPGNFPGVNTCSKAWV